MEEQKFPAKIIEGYRVTIPIRIRARLKLSIGDEVDIGIKKAKPLETEEKAEEVGSTGGNLNP